MQLSRRPSLYGIMLVSKTRKVDFVGNKVPESTVAAEERSELLSNATSKKLNRGIGGTNKRARLEEHFYMFYKYFILSQAGRSLINQRVPRPAEDWDNRSW